MPAILSSSDWTARCRETYANIVGLVKQAQESKAPSERLADRYAIWFLLLTLSDRRSRLVAIGRRIRALAVLVVATPCP